MSSSADPPVEGEGADEDFLEAAADAPDVTGDDDGNDDAESYETEDEDPVEVIWDLFFYHLVSAVVQQAQAHLKRVTSTCPKVSHIPPI